MGKAKKVGEGLGRDWKKDGVDKRRTKRTRVATWFSFAGLS